MINNERANATFKANFPNGLPSPVTQYDLTKAWNDGWATCLQDKEPAFRADERERCRAELRAKVAELDDDVDLSVVAGMWIEMVRWAREEAFGGE